MPRIPTYQPGQVGPVQTTGARFRAADNGGGVAGALADGMQRIGGAVADFAVAQDQINAANDDTQARKMTVEAAGKISALTQQYKTLMGGNAREAQEKTLQEIAAIRDQYFGQATNGRMRALLEQRLGSVYQDEISAVSGHALKEVKAERLSTLASERTMFSDRAVSEDDPIKRQQAVTMGIQALEAELNERGLLDPNLRGVEVKKFTSGIHRDVIDREMTRPDRNVDMVEAYFDANKDEMTAADREAVMGDMRPLLVERQTEDDFSKAVMGMKPIAGEGELVGPFNTDSALRFIMHDLEGGSKSNTDTGGLTKYGISTKGNPDVNVAGLTEEKAMGLYRQRYASKIDVDGLSPSAALVALDASVNHGPEFAKKIVKQSGGDAGEMLALRRAEYARLIRENPEKYGEYEKGWENRLRKIEGRLGGSTEAPGAWDKDEAYRRIDELGDAEGWSLERRNLVKAKADKEIGKREELLARQEREANDAALEVVSGLGEGFTSLNQIPRDVRDKLSVQSRTSLERMIEANTAAKKPEANGQDVVALHRMAIGARAQFATVDLRKYRAFMTPAEYDELASDQARAIKELNDPEALNVRGKIDGAITKAKNWEGVDASKFSPDEQFRLRRYMELRVSEEASGGKALTDADYTRFFRDAVKVQETGGFFGGKERASNFLSGNMRAVITRALRRNGVEPTEDAIQKYYQRMGAAAGE